MIVEGGLSGEAEALREGSVAVVRGGRKRIWKRLRRSVLNGFRLVSHRDCAGMTIGVVGWNEKCATIGDELRNEIGYAITGVDYAYCKAGRGNSTVATKRLIQHGRLT